MLVAGALSLFVKRRHGPLLCVVDFILAFCHNELLASILRQTVAFPVAFYGLYVMYNCFHNLAYWSAFTVSFLWPEYSVL